MTPTIGARFGPYAIQTSLGRGGMGEVYRAVDTRLNRSVAVKVLPRELAESPLRQQRFEREARALSALNHPHICTLYDVGEHDGLPFLVMEYVEGETLHDRLMSGPLPIERVLQWATEIAAALDHAHRHGVVHRDLKPGNIMLTNAGVKVVDFGVAKLLAPDGAEATPGSSHPDTLSEAGSLVGTPQYMAPEQLEGGEADARSDIFALGAVMYEMGTGRAAFPGASAVNVIASILTCEPRPMSVARLEQRLGPSDLESPNASFIDEIVDRCLAKEPDDRWQTASDLRRMLQWVAGGTGVTPAEHRRLVPKRPGPPAPWWRRHLSTAVGVGVAIAAVALAFTEILRGRPAPTDPATFQFSVAPPDRTNFDPSGGFMTLSPDGRMIAFFASSVRGGSATLWIRPLNSVTARELPGTEGGQPFWSPDSRFLIFNATRILKKIEVASGATETLGPVPFALAGTWGREGVILVGRASGGQILRIPLQGGPTTPVTTLDPARGETSHMWPQFLPDGRHFLYRAEGARREPSEPNLYVGSLDSATRTAVAAIDSQAVYAPPGYLLFVRRGALLAQPFDAQTFRLSGEPVTIAEQVRLNDDSRRAAFSVSDTGVLAYQAPLETQLQWVDRQGRMVSTIGLPGRDTNPALSPDGRRLAVSRPDPVSGVRDIWVIELGTGVASRLTVNATANSPLWSPDGSRVIFKTLSAFMERAANGSGADILIQAYKARTNNIPTSWPSDGRSIVFNAWDERTGEDIWMLPLTGDRTPVSLIQTEFAEGQASVSPDGRWIAYVSNETGRREIYVRPFPSGESRWQVSVDGGFEPQWRRDGHELFFLAPDRSLMSASVTSNSRFASVPPVRLFETRLSTAWNVIYVTHQYAVSADGRRFLLNQPSGSSLSSPITVVVNWTALLKK
jgi:serine/threonine protein kinase/Tol biopolymer transport system component